MANIKQFKEARLYTYLTMFVVRRKFEDAKYFTVQEMDTETGVYFLKEIERPKEGTYKIVCDNPAVPQLLENYLFNNGEWEGIVELEF